MIAFLEGKLAEKHPTHVVLNVGGVGYAVSIPLSSYDGLPSVGESCRLLIVECLREDSHQLYGFRTEEERACFTLLTTVSGVGPRVALRALSGLSVRALRAAIANGDTRQLSAISGIGKKTAERMVVELRDKVSPMDGVEAASGTREMTAADRRLRDAVLALMALGYKQSEARQMVAAVLKEGEAAEASVETLVRRALGNRGG